MPDSLALAFLDSHPIQPLEHPLGPPAARTPLVILHGLFGSARNWQMFVKRFGQGRATYALDLRNHGNSPWDARMDYPAMAADVGRFLADRGLDRAVLLGHSMGGKTAMTLALTEPKMVERLIVVDIAPVPYSHSHSNYVDAMKRADLTGLTRRSQVDEQLRDAVPDPNLRAFLLQNLDTADGTLRWRVNLDAIGRGMSDLVGFPDLGDACYPGPVRFIGGGASDYITPTHDPAIRRYFPQAEIRIVPGTGHWVHAEKPDVFTALIDEVL